MNDKTDSTERTFQELITYIHDGDFDKYAKLLSSDQNYHLSIQKDNKGFDFLHYAERTKDPEIIDLTLMAQKCANEVKEYELITN